ncbi:carbohydrate ABC transporter permease [Planosporangium sp. 12N6]|uniref:carbohydrate ABC transporter permease n=1 Tax=Planosporangium spinosum TaxID=3402278 RepID=UPI003CF7E949
MTLPATQAEPSAPRATPPIPGGRRPRRRIRRLTSRDILTLSLLLGIPVLLDLALIWGPTATSVLLSFTSWDGLGEIKPVGTKNYHTIFEVYPLFWPAVRHNLLWLAFLGLVATPLGMFFAVLLDKQIRFSRFYQSALFLPVVLSLAIVGFIAQLVFSRDYGALNSVLGRADHPTDWLGDPHLNIWVMMIAASWRHVGYVMILYLAGLKSVDPALKESASLDGANEAQTFFRITFPTLRPVNIILLVITVIEGLRAFDVVYVVNSGRNGLELLSVLVFDNIVGEASRIGFGSALAVILFVISLGFIVTYLSRIMREEDR